MTDDSILERLRQRATAARRRSDGEPNVRPAATRNDIESAELALGINLPPLLKRIYLEIGNGGCMLGPGYGLLGLPGGYDNDDDWNIVKTSLEMARDYEWWDGSIVVCDWGCTMMSCIDCSDDDFPVYRYDGNFFDEPEDDDEPPEDAWTIEADTFAEWLLTPNYNANPTP
jgi:hypothetical protein